MFSDEEIMEFLSNHRGFFYEESEDSEDSDDYYRFDSDYDSDEDNQVFMKNMRQYKDFINSNENQKDFYNIKKDALKKYFNSFKDKYIPLFKNCTLYSKYKHKTKTIEDYISIETLYKKIEEFEKNNCKVIKIDFTLIKN